LVPMLSDQVVHLLRLFLTRQDLEILMINKDSITEDIRN